MSAFYGTQIQLKPTEAFLNYWPYYSYSPFYRHSQTFDQYKYGLMNDWYFKTPYHCHSYRNSASNYFSPYLWRYENSLFPN
ncbi:hypothetical protein niasHT_006809 [Heterodera trifolii]|uniref:Uncharacterized protein n=1 Tax=Heterodera trifolii TaxID=157864 RepID=A0ABD2M750_9BILA